jgi:26S proteasome regulatory subunit N8
MNHQITYMLQNIFNLLPDIANPQFVKSINVNTNDQMLVVYAASLIRSIIALHNLINNKLTNKEAEKKEGKKDDKEKEKDKDGKDKDNKDDKDSKDKEKEKSKAKK